MRKRSNDPSRVTNPRSCSAMTMRRRRIMGNTSGDDDVLRCDPRHGDSRGTIRTALRAEPALPRCFVRGAPVPKSGARSGDPARVANLVDSFRLEDREVIAFADRARALDLLA